jgi:hypothetical protein
MASDTVIHHLNIASRRSVPKQPVEHPIYVGRRYPYAEGLAVAETRHLWADQDLLVGGYRIAGNRAEVLAADPESRPDQLFVWNADVQAKSLQGILADRAADTDSPSQAQALVANRLQLASAQLVGPELEVTGSGALLSMTAAFDLEWHADVCAAELGAVELVQAMRSIRYEDGSEQTLVDTSDCDEPVRYEPGSGGASAIRPLGERLSQGGSRRLPYQLALSQTIPSHVEGKAVADVTVLEKYTTYFMQCEAPNDPDNHIWIPMLHPVMWGWSIRVGRRTDGEWGILRRKLFLPTSMDEGLSLPCWETNTKELWCGPDLSPTP